MNKKIIYIVAAVVGLASVSSCSLYKKYERPSDLKTDNFYANTIQEAGEENMANLSWRELYTDPYLQQLIERALTQNTDVRMQEWAIEQAQASRRASVKAYFPSVTFQPKGEYLHQFGSDGSGAWSYQIPIALQWELDVFGGLTNKKRAAEASVILQQDAKQAIQSRLVANVASIYYQLLALDENKALCMEAKTVWDEMIETSESMMKGGLVDAIAVAQFKAQSCEFSAGLLTCEHAIMQAEINLMSLLGEAPGAVQRGAGLYEVPSPSVIQTGLSAQLLAGRPDVRQAERNLQVFYHNERYAYSEFFPKFTLSLTGAYNRNFILDFIGGLTQPIFAQGKIRANHQIAQADYEKAKLAYQQKILDASGEVVAALSTCKSAHEKIQIRNVQIEEYKKAVEYARTQMLNGEATYLDVLTAQTNLFEKRKTLIDERLEEMQGVIKLYMALGGGTE
ncbi:MAG: TolC family protein [Bacteroidaceae bacterium]|nr:TolC family protein [Bacteroidaceae bacterium]